MNRIINFHDVRDSIWLEKTINILQKKYNIISSKEILNYYYSGQKINNTALITVDDGDLTFYEVMYPVFKKYNIPAIIFVSPLSLKREQLTNFWFQEIRNCDRKEVVDLAIKTIDNIKDKRDDKEHNFFSQLKIDDIIKVIDQYKQENNIPKLPPQNMTAEQIKEIDREGLITIGAHTVWHPFLASEEDERAKWEIEKSIEDLSSLLGHPIEFFAYPNGRPIKDFGEREKEILKRTTVKLAFSTEHKNFKKTSDKYAIPRYGLSYGSPFFIKLKLFMGANFERLKKIINKIR